VSTDAVPDEGRDWQSRALDRMYPMAIFDALGVKVRDADSRTVKNKAVDGALGVTRDGRREAPAPWIGETEGAKFRLSATNEFENRGPRGVLIAVVDGLKGFAEAIAAVFPDATVQTRIVHPVRHSPNFCCWKDREIVYTANAMESPNRAIRNFEKHGGNVRERFAARNRLAITFGERFDA